MQYGGCIGIHFWVIIALSLTNVVENTLYLGTNDQVHNELHRAPISSQ